MAYAQSNYPNVIQGINGKYTISQIGCFLTSFSNLFARYGKTLDPPGVNAFLRDNNLFIDVDDGVRDDVSWDTITKIDPTVTVDQVGGASRPPHNNCIVKFIYNGGNSTHFCLVQDAGKGLIIDSWDGQIKSWDFYGGVKGWASYTKTNAGGDMPSTIGDYEARALIQMGYGYTNELDVEGAVPGLVGMESNTAIRQVWAAPSHNAFLQYLGDLAKAAASGDSGASQKLAQIKKIVD